MGKLGRALACPLGPRVVKRKAPVDTQATYEQALRNAAESDWGKKRCEAISQAIEKFPHLPPIAGGSNDWVPDYDGMQAGDDRCDPNDPNAGHDDPLADNHEDKPEPLTFTQYISGAKYKQKHLKEDTQWTDIMQSILIAFMISSERTSAWGNDALWNYDFNKLEACSCGTRLKHTRTVDTVDLFCQSKTFDGLVSDCGAYVDCLFQCSL